MLRRKLLAVILLSVPHIVCPLVANRFIRICRTSQSQKPWISTVGISKTPVNRDRRIGIADASLLKSIRFADDGKESQNANLGFDQQRAADLVFSRERKLRERELEITPLQGHFISLR